MSKKQPRNAFYFFMLDYRDRCQRNGERFPNGLRDVQEEAGPEWKNMSKEARKKYEDLAKAEKLRIKGDTGRKQTCMHNSFDSVERERREQEKARNEMITFIESTVASLSNKALLGEYKFYLIHVNYFCISEGECYHPAELALCEFSLVGGITNTWSTLINPGQIPLGYLHESQQKSNSTHKIPVDNDGEKRFHKILTDINKFIQPGQAALGGDYPPMFTLSDNVVINTSIKAVMSVIDTLCTSDSYDCNNVGKYRIYPIEHLFFELRNACARLGNDADNLLPNVGLAKLELEKDVFNFIENIACQFHQKEEAVEYCSKSYVQRWVYLICDFCCHFLGITLLPGHHLPKDADVDYRKRREAKKLEEETVTPKHFTWQGPGESKKGTYVAVEEPPVRRPTIQANLPALLARGNEEDENRFFPSLNQSFTIGRGRLRAERGGQNQPKSFAAVMKK